MSTLPANLPSIAGARLPVVYEAAKTALSECNRIDECKDWSDKAEALASYAKQAQDSELRKMADRIQARAHRRCGELLEEIEPAANQHTARGDAPPSRSAAAREAGLSRDQKRTALRVARIPSEEFEAAVESDDPPTVTELSERGKLAAPPIDLGGRDPSDVKLATDAIGWIRSSSEFCGRISQETVLRGLFPGERQKLQDNAATVCLWLRDLVARLEGK